MEENAQVTIIASEQNSKDTALRITRGFAILFGVASLPLIIVGWGLLLAPPMFWIAWVIGRMLNPKTEKPLSRKHAIIATITAGIASVGGVYTIGAFGNLDTSGRPDVKLMISGTLIAITITVYLLRIINKKLPV